MVRRQWWLTYPLLAAMILGAHSGCLHLHTPRPPDKERLMACGQVPCGCRNHVYVFFVNGLDPLDCADLDGVRDYVQEIGFIKTYYGQLYHTHWFAEEMRRLTVEDPLARFAVIGFDLGAKQALDLVRSVQRDHIAIDLLVYLSGTALPEGSAAHLENVGKVVNIHGTSWLKKGPDVAGLENLVLTDTGHCGTPTHQRTLQVLCQELSAVACRVPMIESLPAEPAAEQLPLPRPVEPTPDNASDEWDFLKPESQRAARR